MVRVVFSVVFFVFTSSVAFSQEFGYNIVKGEKTIGSVSAVKKIISDTTVITIKSEAKFKLLLTFKVSYLLEEKFVNGELVSGHAINYLNGKVQKESTVHKEGKKYIVVLNKKKTEFALSKISYSVSNLYFEQPPNFDITIFSQQFADFLPLFKKSAGKYELESENGNNNYYYKNGILTKVKVNRSYANFYFQLKE